MKQVFYKTESSLDNIIIQRILQSIGYKKNIIPLLQDFSGKSGILRKENWDKCMNLTLNPYAILFLLMDLDDDYECVSSFLEYLDKTYGIAHKRDNCSIFFSVREVETWLMADIKGFSRFFGVPEASVSKIFQSSEYMLYDPKGKMKTILASSKKKEVRESVKDGNLRYLLSLQGRYMATEWNLEDAMVHSGSLNRMISKIKEILS